MCLSTLFRDPDGLENVSGQVTVTACARSDVFTPVTLGFHKNNPGTGSMPPQLFETDNPLSLERAASTEVAVAAKRELEGRARPDRGI